MIRYFPFPLILIGVLSCTHIPEVQEAKEIKAMFPTDNVVFAQGSPSSEKDLIPFVIEVPTDSTYKYELRSSTGSLINDRELCQRKLMPGSQGFSEEHIIHGFPANYGISPGKFNQDGDPVDLVVLGQDLTYQDMISHGPPTIRNVRVVGLMKMEECSKLPCKTESSWEQDWKVLAVDPEDEEWGKMKELKEIPQAKLDELSQYWGNYKGHKEINGKYYSVTRVAGFDNKDKALKFFQKFKAYNIKSRQEEQKKCTDLYTKMANSTKAYTGKTKLDNQFLGCLAKVWPAPFFESKEKIDTFLKISAYALLSGPLKENSATVENAISKMQERRDQNLPHYRFVGLDAPYPGTNQPIFEWVKTLDRDQGCIEKPEQHYLTRPLVDLPENLSIQAPQAEGSGDSTK